MSSHTCNCGSDLFIRTHHNVVHSVTIQIHPDSQTVDYYTPTDGVKCQEGVCTIEYTCAKCEEPLDEQVREAAAGFDPEEVV